ncbi:hypothetical protein BJ170DRAFT_599458 [Xylariales sp. AK1849]|nr:hypothetical protein BJ170DRAFT_599458 [Xylariales sp. AK1849]
MASRHDFSAQPRRKIVTYGKTTRKTSTLVRPRQQAPEAGTLNGGAALSRSSEMATTRQQHPATNAFSAPLDSSPEPLSLERPAEPQLPVNEARKGANTKRKRKISHVYSANAQGQDPLSEDSSPSAPKPRRSRVSSPSDHLTARGKGNITGRRMRSASTDLDAMDIDAADGSLSSPPPTPTPPKGRRVNGGGTNKKALPFSPNTMQILGKLKVSDDEKDVRQHQMPVRLASEQRPKPKPSPTSVLSSERSSRIPRQAPTSAPKLAKKPRRKLIDALVEQMEESDESFEERPQSQVSSSQPVVSSSQASDMSALDSQSSPTQTPKPRRMHGRADVRAFSRSGSSLKYTYGQSKVTMLEDDNLLDAIAVPEDTAFSLKGRRLELRGPKKLPSSGLESDDDDSRSGTSPKGKMRDIHELRQAGANSRVADEMFDLSSQIGVPSVKPSSSRRAALLQVAEKVCQKGHRQQLRDHGIDDMILKDVGKETDLISGYLISTTLIHILATTTTTHILRLLRAEDAGKLFGRLLDVDEDIKRLARDRKSNLSKRSQASLAGIQSALLELPIWEPTKPVSISPRTVALKCLDLLISQDVNIGGEEEIFPLEVTSSLFTVLEVAQEPEFWDDPTFEVFDVRCALSVLEFHAVKAMESQANGEKLAAQYLPIVANAFGAALRNPAARYCELEGLLLKLVLNMTNSSASAPDVFVAKGLMPTLSSSVCLSFSQALTAVSKDEWAEGLLDGLVLRLGILINFAEKSMAVRKAVYESPGDIISPMNKLIQLFLTNHRATADADSEAKSHLNVAFGYLSVLLGYLSLFTPVRKAFRSSHPSKSMGPLLDSIQEFIQHHRAMEASLLDAGVDDPRAYGGYTERLEGLVEQLENDAAYD